jgi:ribose transport system substrate-binding protein
VCALALWASACRSHRQVRIAVIPQTEGTAQWDPVHTGAETAAERDGVYIYWNAPTREDDVEAQIALVDRVVAEKYQGLVLAPDQALSLISPVRRALSRGIPTVIIGSPLPIPAGGNLFYILNDDVEGGQMAAKRVASLLHGHGTVAILGINPDVDSIMISTQAFEEFIAQHYPSIRVVEKRMGSFNVPHEQQVAEDTLRNHPKLDVIVSQTSTTTDGVLAALDALPQGSSTKVIGFDSVDSLGYSASFDQRHALDCVIQQDTRSMGQRAVELIHAKLLGERVPAIIHLPPRLITRENINTPTIQDMLSTDFKLGQRHWTAIQ